jgi:hypothetical protein
LKLLLLFIFLVGCSQELVQRNRVGTPVGPIDERFAPMRKRLALLMFFNESPSGGQDLGIIATEELRNELARTGEFIIDPKGASLFGSSQEIYAGGGAKLIQMARKAKVEGLQFVLYGRITDARVREKTDEIGIVRKTKSYTENQVELRIFDVNAQKEVLTTNLRSYADDSSYRFFMSENEDRIKYRQDLLRYGIQVSMRKAIPQIIQIASKLDWQGRVARIVGTRIYINAGRQSGINIGDILKVLTEGEDIFDPATGALLGVAKGEVKGTLEVVEYFGSDGAIAILHSGGSVREGDFVMLY